MAGKHGVTSAHLSALVPGVVLGLLVEHVEPVRAKKYDAAWERQRAIWDAADEALERAAAGKRPRKVVNDPPRWLAPLVSEWVKAMAESSWWGARWERVRALERLGVVRLEHDDTYLLALVCGLGGGPRAKDEQRVAEIRRDPDLVPLLWRLFEVEGGGEVSLANVDKFSRGQTWQATFLELGADGTLERERLLRCCLEALNRDFSAYRAQFFSALHRALEPTAAELKTDEPLIRALLRSQVGPTVTMAVKALRRLSKAGLLDDDEYAALGPGLHAKAKGPVLELIRLLGEVHQRRPDLPVEEVARSGLEHPHSDVQRAALALLDTIGAAVDSDQHLAPTVRQDRGSAIEPTAAPVDLRTQDMSVVPVTAADLLDRTAAILEDATDAVEVELVLAALAGGLDTSVLAPLLKRARRIITNDEHSELAPTLSAQVASLLLTGDRDARLRSTAEPRKGFLLSRMADVRRVLEGRDAPRTLLATPTSTAGWIDPEVFVRRLQTDLRAPDLTAALLRLSPDGRSAAFGRLRKDAHPAVRHALGGEGRVGGRRLRRQVDDPELWVAAARTRRPGQRDDVVVALGLDRAGQGEPVRGHITGTSRRHNWTEPNGKTGNIVHWDWACEVHHAGAPTERQPTQSAGGTSGGLWASRSGDWIPSLLLIHPHDLEPALSTLWGCVLDQTGNADVNHDCTTLLLAMARHPGSVGPLALTVLAAGLAAAKTTDRVLAVDAMAALSDRVAPAPLAEAMTPLAGRCTARWSSSLSDLAQAMPPGFVVDVLTLLLPRIAYDVVGLSKLVELFAEETLRAVRPIEDLELRRWLGSASSGRTAKSAKAMLAR